jgi:hypothetical protein
VFSNVTQEIQKAKWRSPVAIVNQPCLRCARGEIEQHLELRLDGCEVGVKCRGIEEFALGGASTWIANHAGGSPSQCNRLMTENLETAKQQQWDQVPHMEAVGRWVKPGIDRYRALPKSIAQRIDGGGVVDQATSVEIFEDVGGTHKGSLSPVSTD